MLKAQTPKHQNQSKLSLVNKLRRLVAGFIAWCSAGRRSSSLFLFLFLLRSGTRGRTRLLPRSQRGRIRRRLRLLARRDRVGTRLAGSVTHPPTMIFGQPAQPSKQTASTQRKGERGGARGGGGS